MTYQFDAIDNLTQKTSSLGAASSLHVGSYTYDAAHPRHVRQAGNTALAYDASGNVTRLNTLQFTRDHLGRVTEIRDGDTVWSKLWYDLSTNRIKRERNHVTSYFYDAHVAVHGGLTRITLNLGKHQVATVTSTALAARFLNDAAPAGAPDGAITAADAYASRAQPDDAVDALLTAAALRLATATTGGRSVEYSHHDYLASPVMRQLDDGSAPVMSVFGPHGEQRERSRSTALHAALGTGFLGHDFEDQAGLVHMGAFLFAAAGHLLVPGPHVRVVWGRRAQDTTCHNRPLCLCVGKSLIHQGRRWPGSRGCGHWLCGWRAGGIPGPGWRRCAEKRLGPLHGQE
ncbi:MAG: hypothetical protein IPI55_16685 [Flavobacteriales bacterium]|nr:hypothetical protein [Flavobacteriales bacterium]